MVFMLAAVFKGCDHQDAPAVEQAGQFNQAQVSENQESGNPDIKIISVDQAYELFTEDNDEYLFIDVRTEGEFSDGHIQGALNIPVSQIRDSIDQLPRDRFLVVYCNGSTCDRSGKAAEILAANGFKPVYDIGGGGIMEWMYKQYPYVAGQP